MSIAPAERVETSLKELAGLDFEAEIPCNMIDCYQIAVIRVVHTCCGYLRFRCDSHLQSLFKVFAKYAAIGGVDCAKCGREIKITDIRFEPLK
ncbi:hypothetical protein [Sinomonas sp.]|uniref:hypothetical protein n=1 Tax=Sinomonas sp. TaxID=1914986 RepID=UPI003F811A3F